MSKLDREREREGVSKRDRGKRRELRIRKEVLICFMVVFWLLMCRSISIILNKSPMISIDCHLSSGTVREIPKKLDVSNALPNNLPHYLY